MKKFDNLHVPGSGVLINTGGQPEMCGTTTLRRMINAVYDETDPLHHRYTYSECMGARGRLEDDPDVGDEVVYIYYHAKEDQTIMTNIKDDVWGAMGSSAGFEGRVEL